MLDIILLILHLYKYIYLLDNRYNKNGDRLVKNLDMLIFFDLKSNVNSKKNIIINNIKLIG